jgi:hypothetical protein
MQCPRFHYISPAMMHHICGYCFIDVGLESAISVPSFGCMSALWTRSVCGFVCDSVPGYNLLEFKVELVYASRQWQKTDQSHVRCC